MSKIVIRVASPGSDAFQPLIWNNVQITKSLDEI